LANLQLSLDQLSRRYLHGTSKQYIEKEDELQGNELVLEDY